MIVERATNAVAAGAVMSPWWMPQISDFASLILTLLGIIWLVVQIYFKIKRRGG